MEQNKTYLIIYQLHLTGYKPSINGKMKVKNSMSDLHAKIKLESYLQRKHEHFSRLVVLSCTVDEKNLFSMLFSNFGKNKR